MVHNGFDELCRGKRMDAVVPVMMQQIQPCMGNMTGLKRDGTAIWTWPFETELLGANVDRETLTSSRIGHHTQLRPSLTRFVYILGLVLNIDQVQGKVQQLQYTYSKPSFMHMPTVCINNGYRVRGMHMNWSMGLPQ